MAQTNRLRPAYRDASGASAKEAELLAVSPVGRRSRCRRARTPANERMAPQPRRLGGAGQRPGSNTPISSSICSLRCAMVGLRLLRSVIIPPRAMASRRSMMISSLTTERFDSDRAPEHGTTFTNSSRATCAAGDVRCRECVGPVEGKGKNRHFGLLEVALHCAARDHRPTHRFGSCKGGGKVPKWSETRPRGCLPCEAPQRASRFFLDPGAWDCWWPIAWSCLEPVSAMPPPNCVPHRGAPVRRSPQ